MMFGPAPLAPADKELGGTLMVFCLTFGLTAGVWSGFALEKLPFLQPPTPMSTTMMMNATATTMSAANTTTTAMFFQ